MADSITVGDLLGTHWDVSYDDPLPLINERTFFQGVIITFVVSRSKPRTVPNSTTLIPRLLDRVLDLRRLPAVRSAGNYSHARLG